MLGGKYVIMNKEKELIEIVNFAIEKCPYYKKTLKPIISAKEFEKLPIIDGSILKENTFPNGNGMFSGRLESAFIFSTGGTTGTPKYTFRDFKDFNDNYIYFDSLDIKPTDIVANLFAPGIWGTFTSHNIGLTQTGCVIIPMGAKDISEEKAEFSINTMKKLRVNAIVGTPSIIIVLIDRLKKYSVNLEIEKIYSVLDIGCATGDFLSMFPYGVKKKGIDICERNIQFAKEKYPQIDFMCSDFYELNKRNIGYYDIIIISEILEHIMNDEELLKFAVNHAKIVLINIPLENQLKKIPEYGLYKHNDGHLRGYSQKDIGKLI